MKFIVVFDNYAKNKKLSKGWGIAIYFPEYHLLMDTGESPVFLKQNLHILKIPIDDIAYIFLTHEHWDHTGGMDIFRDGKRTVFLHSGFTDDTKVMYEAMGLNVQVIDKPCEILPGVFSTGPMGKVIKEHSLVIETREGFNIFTGCSHPGFVEIFDRATTFGTNINLVAGGFHLLDRDEESIRKEIEIFHENRVKKVAPTHCTGDRAREIFLEEFGEDFLEIGAGSEVEL